MSRADGAGPLAEGTGLGALLQGWRERALLTQDQLAARAGLNVRTIRRLETDASMRPQPSTLRLLIKALNLDLARQEALKAAVRGMPAGGGDAEPERPPRTPDLAGMTVLRQLPAPSPTFTGRVLELTDVDRSRDMSAVVITAIDGMAGVGKTALALHAAHQLSGEYPDGQLFLDLHGFTHGVAPVQPPEALDRLLRALGLPGEQIPEHVEDRAALYRSRLAGRKVLVVLDNAANEAQVEPLLPGTAGCLVMVTSRRRLARLDRTRTVSLDVLPETDAVDLFVRAAALDGVDASVADVVELCGRLPLAIRIAAARLRSRSSWTASHLVERLRDQRDRLGALEVGPRSVTTALDMSYLQLGPEARRAYRLCGSHPGSDFDLYAIAALVDATRPGAERLIDELVEAHLLQEPMPGRYGFHDLVRTHATGAVEREETEPDRLAALERLFDHYRHTVSVAMDFVYPYERDRRPPVPSAGTPAPDLPDSAQATAWLDIELPNLLTAAQHAATHGTRNHTVHLSRSLDRHLSIRNRYVEAEVLHSHALSVARRTDDVVGETDALINLAHVIRRLGRTEQAVDHCERALALARSLGNHRGEMEALFALGSILGLQGRHDSAAAYLGLAIDIARRISHRSGEQDTLYLLGWLHLMQHEPGTDRRYDQADNCFEQALAIARSTGNPIGEVKNLLGRAWIHRSQGSYELAADAYQESLDLVRRLGSVNGEIETLDGMGRLDSAAGRPGKALNLHGRALELATDLQQPVDQARSHDGLARAHHALGRRDEARRQWQAALYILTDIGTDITADEEVSTTKIAAHLNDLGS